MTTYPNRLTDAEIAIMYAEGRLTGLERQLWAELATVQADLKVWKDTATIMGQSRESDRQIMNQQGAELARVNAECAAMRKACETINKAHQSLFSQCCSNPIYNSWKKEVNVTLVNQAHQEAEKALKGTAGSAIQEEIERLRAECDKSDELFAENMAERFALRDRIAELEAENARLHQLVRFVGEK